MNYFPKLLFILHQKNLIKDKNVLFKIAKINKITFLMYLPTKYIYRYSNNIMN